VTEPQAEYVVIDRSTIETIKLRDDGKATKVINLIKAIQKFADDHSGDPYLIAMAERARAVQEAFETRQQSTEEALENLIAEIEKNEARKKDQAARGLDNLSYFLVSTFTEKGISNAENVAAKVRDVFIDHPNWNSSEAEYREARTGVTLAIAAELDNTELVSPLVEELFLLLHRGSRQ